MTAFGADVTLDPVLQACSDAVIETDSRGRPVAWNRAASRILGAALERGQPLDGAFVDPAWWQAVLRQALDGQHVDRLDGEAQRAPGRPIPVVLSLVPRSDGVVVVMRDISELEFAQRTLAESARRVHRAEALALTGTFVVSVADGASQWSEGMYRIHRVEPSSFAVSVARHLGLVDRRDRAAVREAFSVALAGRTPSGVDHRVQCGDGSTSWVFMAVEPSQDAHGAVVGLRGVCQDINGRIASEVALAEALKRELAAGDELRRLDSLKDEFLATVSHELRTPLTAVAGFSQLLAKAAPEHEKLVAPILRNAGEMQLLVERLLDQARLEAGRVQLDPIAFGLAPACAEVLADLATTLEGMHVELTVAEAVHVLMDPQGFTRVLSNLLSNAAKYAPGGTIVISAEVDGATVTVSVSDDGPGIPEAHQDRIFEPFYRVPGSSRSARGSGFGLSIVRRWVELNGGTVWLQSAPGKGTTFRFTVPAAAAAPAPAATAETSGD